MRAVSTRSVVSVFALATAFVAGAEAAQACSILPRNAHNDFSMQDYVREAHTIVLARALAVRSDIDGAIDDSVNRGRPMGDTHIYEFQTIEVLKGQAAGLFDLRGGPPFGIEASQRCSDAAPEVCGANAFNDQIRSNGHRLADSGRHDWEKFYTLQVSWQSGMGMAISTTHTVSGGGDCRTYVASFEIGEAFLIFRGEDGAEDIRPVQDTYGLNHHLIKQPDDAWLEAVRHFVASPEDNTLPPQPFEDLMAGFGQPRVVRLEECEYSRGFGFVARIIHDGAGVSHQSARVGNLWHALVPEPTGRSLVQLCHETQEFLAYPNDTRSWRASELPPFPIINGRVDFSYLPGPWTFTEGDQVPLHVVMAAAEADD